MRQSMHVKGLPTATGKESMLDEQAWDVSGRVVRVMVDLGKTVGSSKWGLLCN